MKLNHTPLGTVVSKKKLLLGALALALVGGIAPTSINNTYATFDPGVPDTVYTVVGPDYFTYVDYWVEEGETFRIADTSVADFYQYDGPSPKASGKSAPSLKVGYGGPISPFYCYGKYECIQGKKIGTTEIIHEKDGVEIERMPLTSVKLNPGANIMINRGETITGTGAIEGADNNLLHLEEVGARDGSAAVKTGERSYTVISANDTYMFRDVAHLVWMIGDQEVGGGTFFRSLNTSAVDNVYHSAENEALLSEILKDIYLQINTNHDIYYGQTFTIVASDGTVAHFNNLRYDEEPSSVRISLDIDETKPAEVTKDQLTSELPNGTKGVKFTNIKANICECFKESGEIIRVQSNNVGYGGEAVEDDEECEKAAEITQLGQDLDMAISVENVAGVKAGYARKWYVTRDNNGVIERIEATYDEETKTIHFKSNGLGFYAYGYVDEKINNVPGVPNTGIAPQKIIATAAVTITPLIVIAFVSFTVREKNRKANKLAKKHNHFE
jgi:hypothetical protein